MNQYLNNLAKEILHNAPHGLSKVRFAKTIYFVHKGLTQNGLIESDAMRFIRMPLGPVPVGFKGLQDDSDILITTMQSTLSYNTETYILKQYKEYFNKINREKIASIVESLRTIATSELIEISHKDHSWLTLTNGSEYSLSLADIQQELPRLNTRRNISPEIDEQRIQARLVEGIITDIVEESTLLEYAEK
jgi:hypothetical protein